MEYKIIKTKAQYEDYLAQIEQIMDAEPNTPDGDKLELLALLVQKYEEDNFPFPEADPIDVIEYYIEQRGLKNKMDELKMSKAVDKDESVSEVKTCTTIQRMEIAGKIIEKYSMLKKQKGILHEQLFAAMEDYLGQCGIVGMLDLMKTRLVDKKVAPCPDDCMYLGNENIYQCSNCDINHVMYVPKNI